MLMARKLLATHLRRVALLLETSTEYGRGLLRGVSHYSRLHGPWSLYLAPGHLDPPLLRMKLTGCDGIIARIHTPEIARLIRATRLPLVVSSLDESEIRERGRINFIEVRTDARCIAKMAALYLLGLGLRQFAFCGFVNCAWSLRRELALEKSLRDKKFRTETYHIRQASWMQNLNWIETWKREQPGLSKWLTSLPKPVGLMACNDVCAWQVLQACQSSGLHVPDEVAVIGVDHDELMCELADPPLSSVALDLERAGYHAARLLDRLMCRNVARKYTVWVEPVSVIARRSTEVISHEDPIALSALRFIRDHAGKPISITDLVEEVGVARRTLERRFSRAMGRSIFSEISRRRLERAKRLLMETSLACHEVSKASGFSGLKTFYRAFQRAEGLSPGKFRKSCRHDSSRNSLVCRY
jgi:LacI family transcriptional regulator